MVRKINWIHISDLHYGQNKQDMLFPKLKFELFKDLERLKSQIGKFDIVFFTGDLTQSGQKSEFNELTVFLQELWEHFRKLDCDPLLFAIPGNHDLLRADPNKATVRGLKKYNTDTELQKLFWEELQPGIDYYDAVNSSFHNFVTWYKGINIPKPILKHGIIPGDVSAEIEINGIKLSCVGLNTAFLDLTNDDYFGKLAISAKQVLEITDKDPFKWIDKADIALLLTHHDPTWLDGASFSTYNSDINPSGTYFKHLCGHLHVANTHEYGHIGSGRRTIQLAPSLFGVEHVDGKYNRIHGYYAGSYTLENSTLIEYFYPRIVQAKYDGNYKIVPDQKFDLNENNCIIIEHEFAKSITADKIAEPVKAGHKVDPSEIGDVNENILDQDQEKVDLSLLEKVPKISYIISPQNTNIRLVEQKAFVEKLKLKRFVWLKTDWGLDESGFIASTMSELEVENYKNNFILNCEDLISSDEVLNAFTSQFGLSLQNFCSLLGNLGNTILVLNDINNGLVATSSAYNRFVEIIKSITDYSPKTMVILISRQLPAYVAKDGFVKLEPLDVPQLKSYLQDHPNTEDSLIKPEYLERINEHTGGLPKHIERIIEGLRVATIDEILEAETDSSQIIIHQDPMPKSLLQAITTLTASTDKYKLRSLKMLKVLTILSTGEILENLKRIIPNEPLFPSNAIELQQLTLLESNTIHRIMSQVSESQNNQQLKLLKVPRQIRDYINTIITDNEREDILKDSCSLYFGPNWRDGDVKSLKSSALNGRIKYLNYDNCQFIIKSLLQSAIRKGDEFLMKRAANLAINYCQLVYEMDDFKNSLHTAEEIYHTLKTTDLVKETVILTKLYGESLRMNGQREKAREILSEAVEHDEGIFSNADKRDINLEMAMTYVTDRNFEKALEYAKLVEQASEKDSLDYLQSKYLIAQCTLQGDELLKKLRSLENAAKRLDFMGLVNNISLKISTLIKGNYAERSKRLSKVVESKSDYTKIRAITKKAKDDLEETGDISQDLLWLLSLSYSYLYTQRIKGMFQDCHETLWKHCLLAEKKSELLNLFKHSSFFWRITDEGELERKYFLELKNSTVIDFENLPKNKMNLANIEYFKRRDIEINS